MADTDWTIRLMDMSEIGSSRLSSLSLRIDLSEDFSDTVNLIEEVVGEEVHQGALFAYMFRRFGFPNYRSDPGKSLASHLLSTPLPNMALLVSPHASGMPSLIFSFLVPLNVSRETEDWMCRARDAHERRLCKWLAEDAQRPEWAGDFVQECNDRMQFLPGELVGDDFESCLGVLIYMSNRSDERSVWLDKMRAAYAEIDPVPPLEYRTADWKSWSDDDPLKPYVAAAVTTLHELLRSVGIRDQEITIHGRADTIYSRNAAPHAVSAGSPAGDVINADPDTFAELRAQMLQLGDGDIAAGMKAVLAKLDTDNTQEAEA